VKEACLACWSRFQFRNSELDAENCNVHKITHQGSKKWGQHPQKELFHWCSGSVFNFSYQPLSAKFGFLEFNLRLSAVYKVFKKLLKIPEKATKWNSATPKVSQHQLSPSALDLWMPNLIVHLLTTSVAENPFRRYQSELSPTSSLGIHWMYDEVNFWCTVLTCLHTV
jgi:hypothetical protein